MRAFRIVLVVIALWLSGCCGSVSRSDGEGPLEPTLTRRVSGSEAIGGAGGVVVAGPWRTYWRVTSCSVQTLTPSSGDSPDLRGGRLAGEAIYSLDRSGHVQRRRIGSDGALSPPTDEATLPGATALAALAADASVTSSADTIAVIVSGNVVAGLAGSPLTSLWAGEAVALDLDPTRDAVWIVGRAPVPTIDCVSLADARVLWRVPLPTELDSTQVRIVRSGRGVVVYAVDRPIEGALLLAPEAGVARHLVSGPGVDGSRGSFDDASLPPLLLPPGHWDGERLSMGLPESHLQHRGRVACLGGGRFAVFDDRESSGTLAITVVTTPARPGDTPARQSYAAPATWPRSVEGVGWDQGGAFLTSGDTRLLLGVDGATVVLRHPVGDALRHGANHAINGVVFVGEVGVTVGLVGLCVAALPVVIVAAPFVLIANAAK